MRLGEECFFYLGSILLTFFCLETKESNKEKFKPILMRSNHSVEYFLCQNRRVRLNSVEGLKEVQVARRYDFFNIGDSVPREEAKLGFWGSL